jgi:hypothetical protein
MVMSSVSLSFSGVVHCFFLCWNFRTIYGVSYELGANRVVEPARQAS